MGAVLLIVALGPIVGAMLVPRRRFGRFVGWLALLAVVLLVEVLRPHGDGGPGEGLGIAIMMLWAIVVAIAVGLKAMVVVFVPAPAAPPGAGSDPRRFDLHAVATGLLSACLLLYFPGALFRGAEGVWLVHGFWLGAAAVLAWLGWRWPGRISRRWLRWFTRSAATSLMLLVTISLAYPWLVLSQAKASADGRPYCINVARPKFGGYRAARRFHDLSPVVMRGERASYSYLQNHAVLLVRTEVGLRAQNWSYAAGGFRNDAAGSDLFHQGLTRCRPERDFAHRLKFY